MFGDAWLLFIVAELQNGAKRFSELEQSVSCISPATLSNRLKRLEAANIVTRTKAQEDKLPVIYCLTEAGYDMLPLLKEMSIFAEKHLGTHEHEASE
jgi:DNA-binding HxlR family transcriptional regulator